MTFLSLPKTKQNKTKQKTPTLLIKHYRKKLKNLQLRNSMFIIERTKKIERKNLGKE
jgi:hypothetical protein